MYFILVFTAIITFSSLSSPRHGYSLPPSIVMVSLPPVPLDNLPADARIETRMLTIINRALPHIRDLLASIVRERGGSHNIVAFLADMFCAEALPLAAELSVPPYILFLSNLMSLSLLLRLPELDDATAYEYCDLPEPVQLPGCAPMRGSDLLDTVQDRSNPAYSFVVEMERQHLLADGFFENTFDAMEHKTVRVFQELSDKGVYLPVYPVGPFTQPCSDAAAKHSCLRWLDDQTDGSVLYVCFDSGSTLSVEQTTELAAGLEACGQRFLWVVPFPSDRDSSASYFGAVGHGDDDDPLGFLPEGFIERTKDVGLCVPQWAPQVEILQHRAMGGFLLHCRWNSTLEVVDAGVPMLAWPLYVEQRMNALMLEEMVGMGLWPAGLKDKGRVVPREEVAAVARELMAEEKGEATRKMAKAMQKAAAEALALEGMSRKALEAIVSKWKRAHCGAETETSS